MGVAEKFLIKILRIAEFGEKEIRRIKTKGKPRGFLPAKGLMEDVKGAGNSAAMIAKERGDTK